MLDRPTLPKRRPSPPRCRPASLPPCLPPGAAAILDAGPGQCRWPLGDPLQDGFRFCGEPRRRGSYCTLHYRAATAGGRTR